jgi:hypothetical protein
VREEVHPSLEEKVDDLPLPPVDGVKETVLSLVFEAAESMVRKEVHAKVLTAYEGLTAKLVPQSTSMMAEDGEELEEDEFGFLVSEGGFDKFKGSSGLAGAFLSALDASHHVKKLLNPATKETLKAAAGELLKLVEVYHVKGQMAHKQWLRDGGQEQLDLAGTDKKKLQAVLLPIAEFQKAGLEVALAELMPGGTMWNDIATTVGIPEPPSFELSLDMDFASIFTGRKKEETIADFKAEFSANLAVAVGLGDASRIEIRDIRPESGTVQLCFVAGFNPSTDELLSNVLDMFEKESSELPGVLSNLVPDAPKLPAFTELSPAGKRVQELLSTRGYISKVPRASDIRRKLDLLMQEVAVARAQAEVLPEMEEKVADLGLPIMGDIKRQVLANSTRVTSSSALGHAMVHAMALAGTRHGVGQGGGACPQGDPQHAQGGTRAARRAAQGGGHRRAAGSRQGAEGG